MIRVVGEWLSIWGRLSSLSIYELRNVARVLGVEKPSFLERKDLINEIMKYDSKYFERIISHDIF